MSTPHSKPFDYGNSFHTTTDALAAQGSALPFVQSTDRALDAALKSVPLPAGLLSRLGLMVSTMSEEVSDPVDYLGC